MMSHILNVSLTLRERRMQGPGMRLVSQSEAIAGIQIRADVAQTRVSIVKVQSDLSEDLLMGWIKYF